MAGVDVAEIANSLEGLPLDHQRRRSSYRDGS
jgi:hypothetical protein